MALRHTSRRFPAAHCLKVHELLSVCLHKWGREAVSNRFLVERLRLELDDIWLYCSKHVCCFFQAFVATHLTLRGRMRFFF